MHWDCITFFLLQIHIVAVACCAFILEKPKNYTKLKFWLIFIYFHCIG